ncbi:hypothetical protein D0U04_07130 [Bacillus clarus]|uniref:Uncharacterized protein n=1 Tax=Bacillus clarus TaxID=2338372 RepID=A0ABX9KYC3_9BACI|nr:hypothetical protein D0U04_07130 [Bacillus clarus]
MNIETISGNVYAGEGIITEVTEERFLLSEKSVLCGYEKTTFCIECFLRKYAFYIQNNNNIQYYCCRAVSIICIISLCFQY